MASVVTSVSRSDEHTLAKPNAETRGIDLLGLPAGTRLRLGESAPV